MQIMCLLVHNMTIAGRNIRTHLAQLADPCHGDPLALADVQHRQLLAVLRQRAHDGVCGALAAACAEGGPGGSGAQAAVRCGSCGQVWQLRAGACGRRTLMVRRRHPASDPGVPENPRAAPGLAPTLSSASPGSFSSRAASPTAVWDQQE